MWRREIQGLSRYHMKYFHTNIRSPFHIEAAPEKVDAIYYNYFRHMNKVQKVLLLLLGRVPFAFSPSHYISE